MKKIVLFFCFIISLSFSSCVKPIDVQEYDMKTYSERDFAHSLLQEINCQNPISI